MLPPILSPVVQDPTRAAAFSRNMLRALQRANINVEYDDLGGRLQPHVTSTQAALQMVTTPGAAATAPATEPSPNQLPLEECYQYWQQRGFVTVAQPVVRRYGYYPRYMPRQVSSNEAYWYHNTDTGWYGGWGEGANPGWEPNWGSTWAEDRGGGTWSGNYGTFPLSASRYSTRVTPGQTQQVAAIAIEYQLFDVSNRQHIYYILASDSSERHRPTQLESAFRRPLVKAFRQAYAQTAFHITPPQTRPSGP